MRILMYNPNLQTRGGGEKVYLALASELSKNHDVTLFDRNGASLSYLQDYFNTDLTRIKLYTPKKHAIAYVFERIPIARLRILVDILINSHDIKKFQHDLFINNEHYSRLPAPISNSIYMCMFPQDLKKQDSNRNTIIKKIYHYIFDIISLVILGDQGPHKYKKIVANSKYTQSWIKKRWQKDSEILYPICEDMGPPVDKERMILNVGRFSATTKIAHDKKQDFLIEAFKELSKTNNNYRMILVGGAAQDEKTKEHIKKLQESAKGYSIEFKYNVSFSELKKMYQTSDIYWHAAGVGVDKNESPEKMEHFGIVTTEAMSAGCIPIVFNGGGQTEIIGVGENGYVFDNMEQLILYTKTVIMKDPKEKKAMRIHAVKDAKKYTIEEFKKSVQAIFE